MNKSVSMMMPANASGIMPMISMMQSGKMKPMMAMMPKM
jgi:hypothetical protein